MEKILHITSFYKYLWKNYKPTSLHITYVASGLPIYTDDDYMIVGYKLENGFIMEYMTATNEFLAEDFKSSVRV